MASVIPLRDLCSLITKGTTPTSIGFDFSDDGIGFLRVQNISGGTVNFAEDTLFIEEQVHQSLKRSQILPGDVLLSIAGSIGRTGIVPDHAPPLNCNQAVAILRTSEKVYRPFLRHWLECSDAQKQMRGATVTGTIQNLSLTQVGELKIPLPSLPEQRRIAAILNQAEALRAKRREALAQLDSLTQSIFIEMFGDPVENLMGWPEVPFETACPTRLGKMLDQKQQTGQHQRHYLRNANVQWFRFDLSDLQQMDFDEQARSVFRLDSGDLLICEGGEPGRAAIWREELKECYYQKALHRGRPNLDIATPEYLVWLLWFLVARGGLSDHVTSATIAHLTGEKLKAIKIPLPPLNLQLAFVQKLDEISRLRAAFESASTEQENLFSSLQHRAFRGEL